MDRRAFFGKTLGGLSLMALLPMEAVAAYKPLPDGESIQARWTPEGQTVEEITIGVPEMAADRTYVYSFYRTGAPSIVLQCVPLNQRATYRWVAAPGMEILLAPGESLRYRLEVHGGFDGNNPLPHIHTQGRDRKTGDVIVNQREYAYR